MQAGSCGPGTVAMSTARSSAVPRTRPACQSNVNFTSWSVSSVPSLNEIAGGLRAVRELHRIPSAVSRAGRDEAGNSGGVRRRQHDPARARARELGAARADAACARSARRSPRRRARAHRRRPPPRNTADISTNTPSASAFKISSSTITGPRAVARRSADAVPPREPPGGEPADCERIDHVFLTLNARCKRVFVVAGQYREPGLYDCRAAVEFLGHEMHAAAVLALAGLEHAPVRVQPAVSRQQGRVDVEHAPRQARARSRRRGCA